MNRIHNEQTGYKWLNIRWHYLVCLFLAIATLAVYGQVKDFEFIDVDDPLYVTENRYVQQGLTVETVRWAFTDATRETNYWAPVTWLSILLDYELYGMNPGAFHLTNVLFHILNTLLLFFVLWRMTGLLWRSAFVAALFALHPLHVESVVWVTERKDVLSTFFWLLTMLAYGWYVQRPGCRRYVLVLLLFILGLMSKPMLVTLPFVLLLLDYWPLARYPGGEADAGSDTRYEKPPLYLLREKIPFVILIVIMSIMTFLTQKEGGAVKSLSDFPMDVRIANALVTYVKYIIKMFWPSRLAFFYPHPGRLPFWQVSAATIFLALITILSLKTRKRHPYVMVGWLWYLGTLIPVIGLVVIGPYVMADRYTYIPLIGLFMAIVWGVSAACVKWRCPPVVMALVGTGMIAFLATGSFVQVRYWRNSQTLFRHTLSATDNNYLIHNGLADSLSKQGYLEDAIEHYRIALQIKPDFAEGHNHLGVALERSGEPFKAIRHYQEAIRLHPGYALAENNLGNTFVHLGRSDQAITHYTRSLLYDADNPDTHNNLGMALLRMGKIDRAIHHYQQAVRLDPLGSAGHINLTLTVSYLKKIDGALKELSDVLYSNLETIDGSGPIDLIVRKKNKFDQVIHQFVNALTSQPGFAPAGFRIDNYFAASEIINLYNRLLPLYQKIGRLGPENPEAGYYAACIYSVRNQPREAVHRLDNAVKNGFNNFRLMAGDENLDNIRQTPYFKKLLQGKIR